MSAKSEAYDTVGGIMAFEAGEMDIDQVVELFVHLRDSGTLWHLQGMYQRTYMALQSQGLL